MATDTWRAGFSLLVASLQEIFIRREGEALLVKSEGRDEWVNPMLVVFLWEILIRRAEETLLVVFVGIFDATSPPFNKPLPRA
jgi:hypothetical protein